MNKSMPCTLYDAQATGNTLDAIATDSEIAKLSERN